MRNKFFRLLKAQASKLKFALGMSIVIEAHPNSSVSYIPKPYKSVCLISADFEMAWAFRFSKQFKNPHDESLQMASATRANVPNILKIADEYLVPITWATVGHLMLTHCDREKKVAHPDIVRLPYFENEFWKYDKGDWFDNDPCTSCKVNPEWYCPDLIEMIISSKTKHEIGCHTFSHIDCNDAVCSSEVFRSEIDKCIEVAEKYQLKLVSFVHSGHRIGHLKELAEYGFRSYRTNNYNCLGFPNWDVYGLWELKNTTGLDWRDGWSASYHVKRYKKIIDLSIKHNAVCVLWFHPSFSPRFVSEVMPKVFEYLYNMRDDITCMTHQQYTNHLDEQMIS
jgi:peptidoglycan/xylan/chitin deacetylase (PgdA/CDA1 family)